jgi:hypothetical protein
MSPIRSAFGHPARQHDTDVPIKHIDARACMSATESHPTSVLCRANDTDESARDIHQVNMHAVNHRPDRDL